VAASCAATKAQESHSDDRSFDEVPAAQAVHWLAPSPLKVFLGHTAQKAALADA